MFCSPSTCGGSVVIEEAEAKDRVSVSITSYGKSWVVYSAIIKQESGLCQISCTDINKVADVGYIS